MNACFVVSCFVSCVHKLRYLRMINGIFTVYAFVEHLSMRNALRFKSNSLGKDEIRLSYTGNAPIKTVVF